MTVIADHLLGWPEGGFVGVDVFFVISGFLITGLLLREFEASGRISFREFYRRRIKRIMPIAAFVLLVTVSTAAALWGIGRATRAVVEDAAASFAFLANWHFAKQGVDYFDQDSPPSPLQHYWSLSVEEQFYLVWPWLLLGVLLLGTTKFGLRRDHARRVTGVTIGLITLLSLAYAFELSANAPREGYFSTLSRTWELGVGALLAVMAPSFRLLSSRSRHVMGWLGLAGIALALFVVREDAGFPAPWALLPVGGAALIIAAGTDEAGACRPLLTNRVSQYVGDISYSLYLWHFPVVVLLPWVLPSNLWYYLPVAISLITATSALSYRYIEEPARKRPWFRNARLPLRRGVIRYGAAGLVVVVAASCAGVGLARLGAPLGPAVVVVGVSENSPPEAVCDGAAALDPLSGCASINPHSYIRPLPSQTANDRERNDECWTQPDEDIETCTFGSDRNDAKQVALVGDSHADALLPALRPNLESLNWSLTTYLGVGCKLHDESVQNECPMRDVLAELENASFDLVLATGSRAAQTPTDSHRGALQHLASLGVAVVVIDDNPRPDSAAVVCVQRVGYTPERVCETPETEAYASEDPLTRAARQTGVAVVDQRSWFCSDGRCPSVIGNVVVYRDGHHLTATFARTVGPYLVESILATMRRSSAQ